MVLLDTSKKHSDFHFLKFVFIKHYGFKKIHQSFSTCKCDAMYVV